MDEQSSLSTALPTHSENTINSLGNFFIQIFLLNVKKETTKKEFSVDSIFLQDAIYRWNSVHSQFFFANHISVRIVLRKIK